jgi:hypothetical protein
VASIRAGRFGEPASVHCDIDLADLGIESALWYVLNRVLRARTREELFKVVGNVEFTQELTFFQSPNFPENLSSDKQSL